MALSFLHHAGTRIGADTPRLFLDAARLSEPAVAALISEFAARPLEQKDLRAAWGQVEIETADGVGFMGWGFKPYDPTHDLAAITLELAALLDADAYAPDDPELAIDLPAVWLRHAGESGLEDALAAIRATATIQGRLRPDASPDHASQQLTMFLVEAAEARFAEKLQRMSQKPADWFALLGIADQRLFCLVVGRSFVEGIGPYETRETLARFGPGIASILHGHVAHEDASRRANSWGG